MPDQATLEILKVVLQALSSFAIAGGLIYAAVQFRHSQRATRVANFAKLVELQMHLRQMRVDDPALAHVYRHDVIGMNTERDVREYFFNLMQLSVFEIAWYGHREGQLPDDYFNSWERRMLDIASEDSFRRMIASPSMKIMHDGFQRYITELAARTPRAPGERDTQSR